MTPITPTNPPGSNDKWKRIVFAVIGLVVAGYILFHAFAGYKARQQSLDSPGQSAPP